MTDKKPSFFKRLISVFTPAKIDASTLEELHDALLMADVGVETSDFLIERLKQKLFSNNPGDTHATIWGLMVFQYWYKKYFQVNA